MGYQYKWATAAKEPADAFAGNLQKAIEVIENFVNELKPYPPGIKCFTAETSKARSFHAWVKDDDRGNTHYDLINIAWTGDDIARTIGELIENDCVLAGFGWGNPNAVLYYFRQTE